MTLIILNESSFGADTGGLWLKGRELFAACAMAPPMPPMAGAGCTTDRPIFNPCCGLLIMPPPPPK